MFIYQNSCIPCMKSIKKSNYAIKTSIACFILVEQLNSFNLQEVSTIVNKQSKSIQLANLKIDIKLKQFIGDTIIDVLKNMQTHAHEYSKHINYCKSIAYLNCAFKYPSPSLSMSFSRIYFPLFTNFLKPSCSIILLKVNYF